MASIKTNDKQVLEKLFQMGNGYVLNFSDRTFQEFFRDNLSVEIYSDKYHYATGSKANMMRGFWQAADERLVSLSIIELISYIENQILLGDMKKEDFPESLIARAREIAQKLGHKDATTTPEVANTEEDFINMEFEGIDIDSLGFDQGLTNVLKERIEEIKKCLKVDASLAVVFLCGSSLEGILLGIATISPKRFNTAKASPKKDGKVFSFQDWTLANFIDVGHELGLLGEDVKKHSHALRDFRNYIHPHQQLVSHFSPHAHTAKIAWQVLRAALYEVSMHQG